jgi:hypothetical protein
MMIPNLNLAIRLFVLKAGFASEWLIYIGPAAVRATVTAVETPAGCSSVLMAGLSRI